MKKTPLHQTHIELGAKMVEFAGYDMPIQYDKITAEHHQVRNLAGLFDVSHMGQIIIEGDDATNFLDYMVTNDVVSMKDGQIIYSPMCYEDGGTVDDLLIYRLIETKYLLIVNASNKDKDFEWLLKHKDKYYLGIEDHSDQYGLIALQGPKSLEVLNDLVEEDISEMAYYYFKQDIRCDDEVCLISRTGYTGEDGFEIMAKNNMINKIYKRILDNKDVKPCGLGARDTLRFEAAMPLYGHELTKDINPVETGLSYFIKKDREFIGKKALDAYKASAKRRKVVGLELIDKGIAREGYEVYDTEEHCIGHITTGYKSPTLNKALAMAIIDKKYASLDTVLKVKIRNKYIGAKVVKKRFLSNVQ